MDRKIENIKSKINRRTRPARKVRLSFKSLWQSRSSPIWSFFCPFCKASRKVSFRPQPGGWHCVQIGITALFFMLLGWPWLAWKGVVSFLPFWALFETIYRLRMRHALSCPHCGFDPYLYLDNVERAKEEMDAHWRRKFAEKGIPYPEKGGSPSPAPSVPLPLHREEALTEGNSKS